MGLTNGICFVCLNKISPNQYICPHCALAVSQYTKLQELITEIKKELSNMGKSNLIETSKILNIIKKYEPKKNVGE